MPSDAIDEYGPSRELASHTYAALLGERGFRIGPAKIRLQNTSITQPQCTQVKLEQAVAASRVFGVPIEFLVGLTPCDLCDDKPPVGFTCSRCGRPGGEPS